MIVGPTGRVLSDGQGRGPGGGPGGGSSDGSGGMFMLLLLLQIIEDISGGVLMLLLLLQIIIIEDIFGAQSRTRSRGLRKARILSTIFCFVYV